MKEHDIDFIVGLAYKGFSMEEIIHRTELKPQTIINIISEWRRKRQW